MIKIALATGLALALAVATSASAKPTPSGPTMGATKCSPTAFAGAQSCVGWYTTNLNGGSSTDITDSADALNALLGVTTNNASNYKFLEDGTLGATDKTTGLTTIDFATPLFGETVISFHVGGAKGDGGIGYDGTAFYEFNAGDLVGGLKSLAVDLPGLSNVRVFSTSAYVPPSTPPTAAVPEPATWGMMLFGFFGLGGMLRSRRKLFSVAAA